MPSEHYPDWSIVQRILVDGFELVVLERNGQRRLVAEGYHASIIEFLLNAAKPHQPWAEERGGVKFEGVDHLFHQGFVSGEGWAVSGVYYGHLVRPEEFEEHRQDPEFVEEQARYEQCLGKPLDEPVWQVGVNSGSWRNVAQYIPQSSIQKIIQIENALLLGDVKLLEGKEAP